MVLRAATKAIKKAGGRKKIRISRIIPYETEVGEILLIFTGLSAFGSLVGGGNAVAKNVDGTNTQTKLDGDGRHKA